MIEKPSLTGVESDQEGFTLIEIVLVIFIVSLFLTLSFPSVSSLFGYKTGKLPERVHSVLRFVNDAAINGEEDVFLKIDLKKKLFSYATSEGRRSFKVPSIVSVYIPSRGEIRDSELTLFFGPFGYPEPFEIRFDDNRKVVYNPFSGRVKLLTVQRGKE